MKTFKYHGTTYNVPENMPKTDKIDEACVELMGTEHCGNTLCEDCILGNDSIRALKAYLSKSEDDATHSFGDNL